jgi:septal ring factor EnvC (AmiA/AmiB activator)
MTTQCTVDANCQNAPTHTYTWPWGEEGLVCSAHMIILKQIEKNTQQPCVIVPLQTRAPDPMTRDERIALTAKSMALEAELDEAKTRGMQLYRELQEQASTNKTLLAKVAVLEAQQAVLEAQLVDAEAEKQELRTAAARENAELQQLRAIAKVPTAPTREQQ